MNKLAKDPTLGVCVELECKAKSERLAFCSKHYDEFKFGVIKRDGTRPTDYEKKCDEYVRFVKRLGRPLLLLMCIGLSSCQKSDKVKTVPEFKVGECIMSSAHTIYKVLEVGKYSYYVKSSDGFTYSVLFKDGGTFQVIDCWGDFKEAEKTK